VGIHLCQQHSLEKWTAPPQEDLPRPRWTKLLVDGVLLSNAVEYANWKSNPAYPMVCEACWMAECAYHEMRRIARLGSQVLILSPQDRELGDLKEEFNPSPMTGPSAFLMPARMWHELAWWFSSMPPFDKLSPVDEYDLIGLWYATIPEPIRPRELPLLPEHLERLCLASDPLNLDEAISKVRALVAKWQQQSSSAVDGDLTPLCDARDPVTSFYFDGPPFHEWPAFVADSMRLVIGGEWLTPRVL
jgi:hypothetical protein